MVEKVYIGIDDHTRTCTFAVLDEQGESLCSGTVKTHLEALRRWLKSVKVEKHLALEN